MTSAMPERPEPYAALTDTVRDGIPSAVAQLCDLVRIPSVSWSAFPAGRVQDSAEAVARLAEGLGVFDSVEILRAPQDGGAELGQPAVLATRAAMNGRPTIMLYAHHDVQPPGDEALSDSPPYEPTVRGERLYGRGAADDKAGVMTHIAAIRALARSSGSGFDLGLVLFVEGEEEFGSRSFTNFLHLHGQKMASDVIVVADSSNWDVDTPALTVALRGNVTFLLTVTTLEHASHSGMFGGAVPDAMLAMVRLLATLHDERGSVAVGGLRAHDAPTPDYDEQQLRRETGLLESVTPIGAGSILSRIWFQPAITVTGIDAPTVANASNTLIPTVTVRVSVRIAPGQDAAQSFAAVERHLRDNAPFGARIEISDVDTGEPFLVGGGWAVDEAKKAMTDAWGVEAVETGIGGSIPFISDLVERFPDAQVLVTGVEDPDSRAHSPNESLHLGVFRRAILAEALLLARLDARHS